MDAATNARMQKLLHLPAQEQLSQIANLIKQEKKQEPKVAKQTRKKHGRRSEFPPPPAENGTRYYHTKSSLTGEARISAGVACLHAHLLKDRNATEIDPEECLGYNSLEDAAAEFYRRHPDAINCTRTR